MNEMYAEEIPVDEYTTDEKDKTIHVFHFTKELGASTVCLSVSC